MGRPETANAKVAEDTKVRGGETKTNAEFAMFPAVHAEDVGLLGGVGESAFLFTHEQRTKDSDERIQWFDGLVS